MKYKSFALGMLFTVLIGCVVGSTMVSVAGKGKKGIGDLRFGTVVEIKYSPPGLLDTIEDSADTFLDGINPGLSDELQVYRHNLTINGNGDIVDRIIYVGKTP